MHYHQKAFVETVDAERQARGSRGRIRTGAADLEEVVRAASAGDGAAWAALVERFAGRIRAVTQSHRLSQHDAEDVMQSTWLRLFENIGAVRAPRAVGSWVATTARRESLRSVQVARRHEPTEDHLLDIRAVEPVDADRLTAAERRSTVAGALRKLSARDAAMLAMMFAEPAPSYAEISAALDMPVGSIGPTRLRSIARLRRDRALRQLAE
jgi:RNA polymerase sigma factor (sigma-70 family)